MDPIGDLPVAVLQSYLTGIRNRIGGLPEAVYQGHPAEIEAPIGDLLEADYRVHLAKIEEEMKRFRIPKLNLSHYDIFIYTTGRVYGGLTAKHFRVLAKHYYKLSDDTCPSEDEFIRRYHCLYFQATILVLESLGPEYSPALMSRVVTYALDQAAQLTYHAKTPENLQSGTKYEAKVAWLEESAEKRAWVEDRLPPCHVINPTIAIRGTGNIVLDNILNYHPIEGFSDGEVKCG